MQFDLSQPKNRIKILIIFVFVILSVVLLTFLFTRKPITLVSSDTVLTNVQYPITSHDQYYNTDALYFFTGTNVARVDTSTLSNDASESILEEYAYVNPELARFNNKTSTLLVRVDPGYLSYMPELNTKSQNSEQLTAWVLQSKKVARAERRFVSRLRQNHFHPGNRHPTGRQVARRRDRRRPGHGQ